MKTEKALRLVGYVRVSTEDQVDKGHSLADQRQTVTDYARLYGHDLVGVEEDAGVSAKVAPAKRPGLSRALDAVRRKKVDGILFVRLDRLSRVTRHVLEMAEEAARKEWHLISVVEHLDTSTASGRAFLSMLATFAQWERETISERTAAIARRVAQDGRARSGRLPFGYRLVGRSIYDTTTEGGGGKLALYETEQRVLRIMLSLRANGFGARKITRALDAREERNPRTGGRWTTGTVAAILRTHARRKRALSA